MAAANCMTTTAEQRISVLTARAADHKWLTAYNLINSYTKLELLYVTVLVLKGGLRVMPSEFRNANELVSENNVGAVRWWKSSAIDTILGRTALCRSNIPCNPLKNTHYIP